jgi:pimeloyl-ACP methyl ester carboxylesterase
MMRAEPISIVTDTIPLDGFLFLPDGQSVVGAALIFHGGTTNFYTGASSFLPPALTKIGYACLAFNRRGHDILSTRDSRVVEGGAFQTIAEGIEDNQIAANWMSERGFPPPVIIGHSYGGILAVAHAASRQDTPALILLSAIRGDPCEMARLSRAGLMAGDRLEEIATQAREMVATGRNRELIMMPGWWYVSSAESFLDRMTEAPDILALAPRISCPTLYVRGSDENPVIYPAEAFQARMSRRCDVTIIPECGHFYTGREMAVIDNVTTWLQNSMQRTATSCD